MWLGEEVSGIKKLPVPWCLDDDVSGKVNQDQSLGDRRKRRRRNEIEGKGRDGGVVVSRSSAVPTPRKL